MALLLIALDPGTSGTDCPALFLDTNTGDLVFQGYEVTNEDELAQVNGASRIRPGEVVGRIPARMRKSVLRALLEADSGEPEQDSLRPADRTDDEDGRSPGDA